MFMRFVLGNSQKCEIGIGKIARHSSHPLISASFLPVAFPDNFPPGHMNLISVVLIYHSLNLPYTRINYESSDKLLQRSAVTVTIAYNDSFGNPHLAFYVVK